MYAILPLIKGSLFDKWESCIAAVMEIGEEEQLE